MVDHAHKGSGKKMALGAQSTSGRKTPKLTKGA